jgi:hypothetical protein
MTSRELGKRNIKSSDYRHLEANLCPCQLIVNKISDDNYELIYFNVHLGHSFEKKHLNISKEVKQSVAELLNQQVNPSYLIEQSKEVFDLQLTNKDLINIRAKFKINCENHLHSNDYTSVDMFVNDFTKLNHILCYKKQNEKNPLYPNIDEKDFFIGFATRFQIQFVKEYIKSGKPLIVQMDSTFGLNKAKFNLVSMHLKDEFHESFPIAYLLSSKEDTNTLVHFIQGILFNN